MKVCCCLDRIVLAGLCKYPGLYMSPSEDQDCLSWFVCMGVRVRCMGYGVDCVGFPCWCVVLRRYVSLFCVW